MIIKKKDQFKINQILNDKIKKIQYKNLTKTLERWYCKKTIIIIIIINK
jgi:hypothetical protein